MRLLFLIIFIPLFITGQEVPLGQWKEYLPYYNPEYILEVDNALYCVTENGLFVFDKEDGQISRLSKITGLSDINVSKIAYSKKNNAIVIVYKNTNIDILKNGVIINLSDIKRADISGIKKINNIKIYDDVCYFSCSFGVVVLDITNLEIQDTYYINPPGGDNFINQVSVLNDSIYVASNSGVYSASVNNNFLSDYHQWQKHEAFTIPEHVNERFVNLIIFNDQLIVQVDLSIDSFYIYQEGAWEYISSITNAVNPKIISANNQLIVIDSTEAYIYNNMLLLEDILSGFSDIEHILKDDSNVFWVADKYSGLLKYVTENHVDTILPNSPKSINVHSLEFFKNKLYVIHGGHSRHFGNVFEKSGASIMGEFNIWSNYNHTMLGAYDVLNCAVKDNKEYFGCWGGGIVVVENNKYLNTFGFHNTDGALDTISCRQTNNSIRVSNLKVDKFNNLWGLNSEVANPLFVLTNDNVWEAFTLQLSPEQLYFSDFLIDDLNQKWGVIAKKGSHGGLFVYNDNETVLNTLDDQFKILNTSVGNGNLPTTNINCIAKDLNGEIWVGTEAGISVFYSPELIFSNFNFDAQQILIQDGDYGQYLLSTEIINCIVIDGANRKWIGTKNSGIYLLSEDGISEIYHFTDKNSPLFSNNILDITINPLSGEVFIATENGLLSYKSDATEAQETQNEIRIFPNPVRENYIGLIAFDGLVANANIKITDISGNLVFEGVSNGGRGTWNGLNKNGERVGSGIYLVFTTDILGEETAIGKILFIQ